MSNRPIRPVRRLRGPAAAKESPAPQVLSPDVVVARSLSGSAEKVSVTIDSAVLGQARIAAKRAGRTLSAHISEALERDLRRQRMAELIAEFEAEHGAITAEEVAKAIASWQG